MPTLLEHEAKELLTRYGIATTLARLAADAETAAAYARACGGPVALKVASSDIVHKSRAGCVRLNVAAETVPGAFREILDANPSARREPVRATCQAIPTARTSTANKSREGWTSSWDRGDVLSKQKWF